MFEWSPHKTFAQVNPITQEKHPIPLLDQAALFKINIKKKNPNPTKNIPKTCRLVKETAGTRPTAQVL